MSTVTALLDRPAPAAARRGGLLRSPAGLAPLVLSKGIAWPSTTSRPGTGKSSGNAFALPAINAVCPCS
ncbi:hypothetical protein [Kitasatospora purpeofusca]|uniref:hypothetical protein n=1 Tax=Kitasatospora purpeofusca TaxID=67352 RepID=UPI00224E8E19|nr:hypothetical protein [Kitasatospora purpeofusca]MCX4757095.1 hypothetical protein [Kitasatospora purpeofusca]WSR35143.1 hypothetical protein OG715_31810 [Kitasatospora purpeofusca]WSR43463.1 hypothetical protein OG196_32840 [Kitasatospora purpeofusca]